MPHLSTYLRLADHSEMTLADSLRAVADGHAAVADVYHTCGTLAAMSDAHRELLAPILDRHHDADQDDLEEPERLHASGLAQVRTGEIGLLRDLQDLHVLADLVQTSWTVVAQGAQGLRDRDLLDVAHRARSGTLRQLAWFDTRIASAAPQALIITPRRRAPA